MNIARFFQDSKNTIVTSTLNISGLVIAFTSLVLITMGVYSELSYDKFHPNAQKIYRIEKSYSDNLFNVHVSNPLKTEQITSSIPDLENYFLISPKGQQVFVYQDSLTGKNILNEEITAVSPSIVNSIEFKMTEGNAQSLNDLSTIIIPRRFAQKLFGKKSGLGNVIQTVDARGKVSYLKIGGVYQDFPDNSIIRNTIYSTIQEQDWGALFFVLHTPSTKEKVENLINTQPEIFQFNNQTTKFRLTQLPDIYFSSDTVPSIENATLGNKDTLYIFIIIAILIIFIATINFINFTIALIPIQLKSINTRKILGCSVATLRLNIIGKTILISLFAYVLSIGIVYCITKFNISHYFYAGTILFEVRAIFTAAGGALLIGIIAGIYPAFYSTSRPTAMILKGSFALSGKGRWFRTALIGFQFTISIVLIIVSCFMNIQYYLVKNKDMGFKKERLLEIETMGNNIQQQKIMTLLQNLKQHTNIEEITFSDTPIFLLKGDCNYNGEIRVNKMDVSPSFVSMLDIKILEGRDFNDLDNTKEAGTIAIVNKKAQQQYNLNVGDILGENIVIVGVVDNFYIKSLYREMVPLALFNFGTRNSTPYIYVKINTPDYRPIIEYINESAQKIDPFIINKISFVDDILVSMYKEDHKKTQLITLFSLISIAISLIGVFGLVLFETRYRKKEIGIRKVMGATIPEILAMFNRSFLRIVIVCFIIAVPIAYYATTEWLNSFTYKTPLHPWVFCFALLIVVLITSLTVTLQSYKAATENPVDSVKTE